MNEGVIVILDGCGLAMAKPIGSTQDATVHLHGDEVRAVLSAWQELEAQGVTHVTLFRYRDTDDGR